MSESVDKVPRRTAAQKKGQYATYAILLVVFGSCVWAGYFGLFHIDKTIYTESDATDHPPIEQLVDDFEISSIRFTHDHRLRINHYTFVARVKYTLDDFRRISESGFDRPVVIVDEPEQINYIVDEVAAAPRWEKDGLGWKQEWKSTVGAEYIREHRMNYFIAYVPLPDEPGQGSVVGWINIAWDDGDS